jgi:hypothetical protein
MMNETQFAQALAKVVEPYLPQFKATGAPVGPYLHGPGGLFGIEGLENDVISSHIDITGSLGEVIPVQMQMNAEMYPYFPYITGFIRSDQQTKDGVCDDPPEAGNMKTCTLTTVYGRTEFRTRELEINRVGELINSGENNNLRLINSPLARDLGGVFQQRFGLGQSQALKAGNEMAIRMTEVGVAFQRDLCPQVFDGNPANNSAGGGDKQFMGLELLVSTTKIDAFNGETCESLYSDVKDYRYYDVQDQNAPWNIVHVLTQMYRKLKRKAQQQRMWPADLRFVMRAQLFDHIADVWACEYPTYRCQFTAQSGNSSATQTINDFGGVRFRDDMKTGQYLLIDGVKVPVILDDCMTEQTAADDGDIPLGGYSSDIYLLPFSIRNGSYNTLYWQLKDYRDGTMNAVEQARASQWFWTDGGRFLWGLNYPVNWCITMISKIEPRLILRTPQLAGRLQNVVYTPLQHWDDPLPSSEYWVDGGIETGRPAPSPYSEFNLSGPGRIA